MQVVYERCCGLDVHKQSVVACVITPEGKEIQTFGTMTSDLLELADWLMSQEVTHVAMESTGVYWKPIFDGKFFKASLFEEKPQNISVSGLNFISLLISTVQA